MRLCLARDGCLAGRVVRRPAAGRRKQTVAIRSVLRGRRPIGSAVQWRLTKLSPYGGLAAVARCRTPPPVWLAGNCAAQVAAAYAGFPPTRSPLSFILNALYPSPNPLSFPHVSSRRCPARRGPAVPAGPHRLRTDADHALRAGRVPPRPHAAVARPAGPSAARTAGGPYCRHQGEGIDRGHDRRHPVGGRLPDGTVHFTPPGAGRGADRRQRPSPAGRGSSAT